MPEKVEDEKKPAREKKNGNGHGEAPEFAVPSIPPPPALGPWRSYKEVVSQLVGRIVEA